MTATAEGCRDTDSGLTDPASAASNQRNMTVIRILIVSVCFILAAFVTACTKDRASKTAKPTDPLAQTASERVSDLRRAANALSRTASQMPGPDPISDRKLTAQALGQTATALAAIGGNQPGGAFRQQLRIIESSRAQIDRASASVPMEPATDTAIRAVYNALVSLRDSRFAGNADVSKLVNDIGTRTPQLDAVRGPLHSQLVSEVVDSIVRTLDVMSKISDERMAASRAPAAAPTPAAAPMPGPAQTPAPRTPAPAPQTAPVAPAPSAPPTIPAPVAR